VAQWLEPEDVRLTVRKREELASAGPPSRDSYGMPTNGNGGAPEDEAPAGPMVLDKLRRLR
jgi:hypothetical protein